MKKILIFMIMLTLSATVFAFGGGSGGRKSTAFTSGVDAIGVHMNGKDQADIDLSVELTPEQIACVGKDEGASCGEIQTCKSGSCQIDYDIWYQGDCEEGQVAVKIISYSSFSVGCAGTQDEASSLCPSESLGPCVCGTGTASVADGPDSKKWFECGKKACGLCL